MMTREQIASDLFDECKKLKEQLREKQVEVDFANLSSERRLAEVNQLTDKLHAYEKQWTDMDYTISHLRQENAELKAEVISLKRSKSSYASPDKIMQLAEDLQRYKAALEKCSEALDKIGFFCSGEGKFEKVSRKALKTLHEVNTLINQPNPQTTQDPATAIAYGLYPSSARPVNPGK